MFCARRAALFCIQVDKASVNQYYGAGAPDYSDFKKRDVTASRTARQRHRADDFPLHTAARFGIT